jgi:hypothetical protein
MRQQGKAGPPEVELLSLVDSRAVEAASLNRFGHLPGDVLDWRGVPIRDRLVYDDEPEAIKLLSRLLAERAGQESELVVLWGSLALPSVKMPVRTVEKHLPGIVEVGPQFWIFLPNEQYLIECLPDGQITGAYVPAVSAG